MTELRELLVGALREAAASAAVAARRATNGTPDELAQRVHRFRKAVRRARAILELAWEALPRDLRREARDALRASRRALGDARDHTVAPHTLARLAMGDDLRATASRILAAASAHVPRPSEVQTALEEGAVLVQGEVDRVIAELPESISWSVVRHGIERVYRRARRARKRARRDLHQFHVWRRRSKELSYQLDLLAGAFGERMAAIAHDLDPVLDAQSLGVDLIMLCQFLRAHLADVPDVASDHVVDELERRIEGFVDAAWRDGKAMFRTKPVDYARAVRHAGRIAPARDTIASDA